MPVRRSSRPAPGADTGAAAVELALVLPVIVLLLVGLIQFGRAYSLQIQLTGAANDGARYLAVHPADEAGARDRTRGAAPNLGLEDSEIAVTASPPCGSTDVVVVQATRVFVFDIPALPKPNLTLRGRGVMPCTG